MLTEETDLQYISVFIKHSLDFQLCIITRNKSKKEKENSQNIDNGQTIPFGEKLAAHTFWKGTLA